MCLQHHSEVSGWRTGSSGREVLQWDVAAWVSNWALFIRSVPKFGARFENLLQTMSLYEPKGIYRGSFARGLPFGHHDSRPYMKTLKNPHATKTGHYKGQRMLALTQDGPLCEHSIQPHRTQKSPT